MKRRHLVIIFIFELLLIGFTNCSGTGFGVTDDEDGGVSLINGGGSLSTVAKNSIPIVSGCGYFNEPCVSVKICSPGTSSCQTINNVLLDTGSFGLRLFSHNLNFSLGGDYNQGTAGTLMTLPLVAGSNGTLSECAVYGDNTLDWGPVALADVYLGGESALKIPIHVIANNDTSSFYSPYSKIPASCAKDQDGNSWIVDDPPSPATSTQAAYFAFNGILGIGPQAQDCGQNCVVSTNTYSNSSLGYYYTCVNKVCTLETTVPLAKQVVNPVSQFSSADSNGVVISMASVTSSGSTNSTGTLYFGLGTQSNNDLSGVIPILTNLTVTDGLGHSRKDSRYFQSVLGGTTSLSYVDSGSNYFYLPSSGFTMCSIAALRAAGVGTDCLPTADEDEYDPSVYFCPASDLAETTRFLSSDGINKLKQIPFTIRSYAKSFAQACTQGTNSYDGIGADGGNENDWGFSFFFGKSIYFAIENKSTPLGTGPYYGFKGVGSL